MDEKMKTTLLAVFCFLIIVASFVGMQYVRSIYSQEIIELESVSFKVPNGFSYVNGSHEIVNGSENETGFSKIRLQNQDQTIEFIQFSTTLPLTGGGTDINGKTVYKNGTGSNQQYSFNFNGKGYTIKAANDSDQLVKDIINSMEVKE